MACRPFCDAATGTVPADGAALLVVTAGQCTRAYGALEGVGVNNDGARKGTFSQPSEAGQVEVVRLALTNAGRSARQALLLHLLGPLTTPIRPSYYSY